MNWLALVPALMLCTMCAVTCRQFISSRTLHAAWAILVRVYPFAFLAFIVYVVLWDVLQGHP